MSCNHRFFCRVVSVKKTVAVAQLAAVLKAVNGIAFGTTRYVNRQAQRCLSKSGFTYFLKCLVFVHVSCIKADTNKYFFICYNIVTHLYKGHHGEKWKVAIINRKPLWGAYGCNMTPVFSRGYNIK